MSTLFRIPTLRQELAFTLRLGPPTATVLTSDQGWPTPGGSWFRPSARSAGDGEGTGPVPPTTSISPSTAASSGQRSDLPLPSVGEPAAGENYAACAVAARREHRAGVRHVSDTEAAYNVTA